MSHQDHAFIDIHYHVNPDAYIRRYSAVQVGKLYAKFNGSVILKNHLGCTAAQAYEARQLGLPVYASVVLNEIAGGISTRVVERSLAINGETPYRFIVHLPTVTGRKHTSTLQRATSHPVLSAHPVRPLTVSDESGKLTAATLDILRMARDYPLVISTGHANADEVRHLVDAAVRFGVRLMLNQPANPMTGLSARDLTEIAQAPQVYIEQTALTYLLGYQSRDDYFQVLSEVPQVIYSSDLGQTSQPDIPEWLQLSRQWFEQSNTTAARQREVVFTTAQQMLSLS